MVGGRKRKVDLRTRIGRSWLNDGRLDGRADDHGCCSDIGPDGPQVRPRGLDQGRGGGRCRREGVTVYASLVGEPSVLQKRGSDRRVEGSGWCLVGRSSKGGGDVLGGKLRGLRCRVWRVEGGRITLFYSVVPVASAVIELQTKIRKWEKGFL